MRRCVDVERQDAALAAVPITGFRAGTTLKVTASCGHQVLLHIEGVNRGWASDARRVHMRGMRRRSSQRGPRLCGRLAEFGGWPGLSLVLHATMAKNLTVRLDDELASNTEALARAEGKSLNETVKYALAEAVQRRREDLEFKARVRRIIEEDRELLERLAKSASS